MNVETYNFALNCVTCGSLKIKKSQSFLMPFVADRALGYKNLKITKETTGLRDIKAGYIYFPCNSILCEKCGHLSSDIRFNELQMKRLYDKYRQKDYIDLRNSYEPGYTLRNNKFEKEYHYKKIVENFIFDTTGIEPRSVLDWGGDSGLNTPFGHNLDIHHICDISNVKVINGSKKILISNLHKYNYDLVTSQHVLEHLPWPIESLLQIKKAISNNSFFYIEVPHEPIMRSTLINKHLLKKHWHEHINFYSLNSLAALLKKCGLKVLNMKSTNVSKKIKDDAYIIQCIAK
jgi:hypothetical protein